MYLGLDIGGDELEDSAVNQVASPRMKSYEKQRAKFTWWLAERVYVRSKSKTADTILDMQ